MFFGGGAPFGGPSPSGSRGSPAETELYDILQVSPGATDDELKKAFRKRARETHPDKGGDEVEFKKVGAAYDVLSDPEKRDTYDKYGKEGLEGGMGGAGGADDIFSMLFGGRRGGGGRPRGPKKGESVQHPLTVSLEDLYNSKKFKLSVNRQRVQYPEGMTPEQAVSDCTKCKGQGVVIQMRQIGPGMIQQMQTACSQCSGSGKEYKSGVKTVKEKKTLEVMVERGMKHGQNIVFGGEADESPGVLPGDIVFVVQQKEHELFKRKGADLIIEKDITLRDALCGFTFGIPHLDGRTLVVKVPQGDVIKPNAIKMIPNEGMPIYKSPFQKGRLFILFNVVFPDKIDISTISSLSTALPASTGATKAQQFTEDLKGENVEIIENLVEGKADDFGSVAATSRIPGDATGDDDDDDGHGRGQGVQCAQQ